MADDVPLENNFESKGNIIQNNSFRSKNIYGKFNAISE